MSISLVVTVIGEDRTGLVEAIADTIGKHGGNWLESRMSHLAGKFAGIVHVSVPEEQVGPLREALDALKAQGLTVVAEASGPPPPVPPRGFTLDLVGADHPGIVHDLSQALARHGVNLEELTTECSAAPMSGEPLFKATARLHLPRGLDPQDLRRELEHIAQSLIVDIDLVEGE